MRLETTSERKVTCATISLNKHKLIPNIQEDHTDSFSGSIFTDHWDAANKDSATAGANCFTHPSDSSDEYITATTSSHHDDPNDGLDETMTMVLLIDVTRPPPTFSAPPPQMPSSP